MSVKIPNKIFSCFSKITNPLDHIFYLKIHPDLLEHGLLTQTDTSKHWKYSGQKEGRMPNSQYAISTAKNIRNKRCVADNIYMIDSIDQIPNNISLTTQFHILTRTSMRPQTFDKSIQSILNQTHKIPAKILVSYDDLECLDYLAPYSDKINELVYITPGNKHAYFFNLYCNALLSKIDSCGDTWIIFLDDDDMFVHTHTLEYLASVIENPANNITTDTVLVWGFIKGSKPIEINDNILPNDIAHGEIASCMYCFHASHAHKGKWMDKRGGDFNFFNDIVSNGNLIINKLPYLLTQTVDFSQPHFGKSTYPDIDMMQITKLTPHILERMWDNIDDMLKIISNFNNILFLCADHPGYGGSATNCDALHTFFEEQYNKHTHTKNIFSVYWNFDNDLNKSYVHNNRYFVIDECDLESALSAIPFQPDIIILKSPCQLKLKTLFQCPIIYFIGGLYHTNLNVPYTTLETKTEHDEFINQRVISQIKSVDICFCNSAHTQKILMDIYALDTLIFYSSFVPFYRTSPMPRIGTRQYKYGIVASDFIKPIKNIDESIGKMHKLTRMYGGGNETCLCVGKNSDIVCEELDETCVCSYTHISNHEEMRDIYKNIDTLIQTSFFESCSNTKIEAMFEGCKIIH